MKKTVIAIMLLAGAVSGFSQGQITFTDTGASGNLELFVYGVQSSPVSGATATSVTWGGYSTTEYVGGTASSLPSGSAVYAANSGLSGTGYDAEIMYSTTANDTVGDLTESGAILHFYTTSASLGQIKGSTVATFPNWTSGATTYAVAAWNNGGGAYTTLAAAQKAGEPWGISSLGSITPNVPPPDPSANVLSFSLGSTVPEPSTIALGVMGASALLFRRRK